jgi:alpha-1,6-mannosyltransferase
MKIMDVTEFYSERGGVRGHLDLKGQILRQAGHDHVIVAPGPTDAAYDLPGARDLQRPHGSAKAIRIAGPTLPYDDNYQLLWRLDRVRRVIAEEKPDVLEINSPYLAPFALRGVGRDSVGIMTFWWHADFVTIVERELARRFAGARLGERLVEPLWGLVRRIAQRCDGTFAASRDQVDRLTSHGVPRVRQVAFGIDKEIFRPEARSAAWRAEILAGVAERPIFVAMGRLAGEKQWDVVLEGFFRASARRPLSLVIFGDGPERARLEALARGRSDVRFMGFERDKERLATALASSDAFLHGCPFETFGLSVAQAISSGLPLVVPDRGGAAELAKPSFAELFRASDPEACAEAIERLVARDLVRLRAEAIAGRGGVQSAEDQVEKTVDEYRALLAARRKN